MLRLMRMMRMEDALLLAGVASLEPAGEQGEGLQQAPPSSLRQQVELPLLVAAKQSQPWSPGPRCPGSRQRRRPAGPAHPAKSPHRAHWPRSGAWAQEWV